MRLLERPIQRAAIRMFAMHRCFAVHVPNGSHLAGNAMARIKQVAALKKDGMSPGFPDLIIIDQLAPRVGVVECKREGLARLDPDQVTWRDDLEAIGIPWGLVNSLDCPIRILREWGWR
ncbi:MAG: hypothetical protein BGN95_05810 [Sphingomonas sp. 66-10]|mgnify:CR=1 FL=1|uniref:VRR-NUC domain-containing protein n=1 Tax=Sphingomonas sp. 66-10 TaxID=1895848 RepID=UPI000929E05D|nr:VRR-NUC domain-containing protein [Sphingomonas sp. 66-10]OJU15627.1 MAG: hypothetical protein BGN95_05810 [Sphingomonas sp. 66-10]